MAYVICDPCRGCADTACVDVCPMDCIHGPLPLDEIRAVPPGERAVRLADLQLYINPEECIDCDACTNECPVQAIYPDVDLPEEWSHQRQANAAFFGLTVNDAAA